MEIAQALKEWRKSKRNTQTEMAEAIGKKYQEIERWENGKIMPTADKIKKIAETFHASADTLLGIDKSRWDESEKG